MKNQVLNIEQMKHLQSLGVDTSVASMYWTFPKSPEYKTRLSIVGEHGNLKAWEENEHGIGAFTLQDIINILPINIYNRGSLFIGKHLNIGRYNKDNSDRSPLYQGYYGISPVISDYETAIEAAYYTLIWVIENKHLMP